MHLVRVVKEQLNALTEAIIGAALEEGTVIVEIKAVERLERVHSVQLLSYLRFAKCPVGLLCSTFTPAP